MARQARLKPVYLESHNSWALNVPAALSDTGKRRQLFFASKRDAAAECEKLKSRRDDYGLATMRAMSPARMEAAIEAFKLLDPLGLDLLVAVRAYVAGHKQRAASVSFTDLFSNYIDNKCDRNAAYLRELRITRDRPEFEPIRSRFVSDIKPEDLRPILNGMSPGARNPVMRYLRAAFNFGIKRGLLIENPVDKLDFADRPRKEVVTVPVDQVRAMLENAFEHDPKLLPFLTLGFFCGIRPDGELLELNWSDVRLAESEVTIRPEISKTNRRRFVDLSPNAKAWLEAYAARGGVLMGKVVRYSESELRRHRAANWKAAGIEQWPQTGMRHSFCSNWLAVHKDVNRLVLMSGHDSVDTMWRAYHAGVPELEAAKYWAIRPPSIAGNVISFQRTA